ncbi:Tryptophan--tRNA ligase, mitochondrial [Clarireedia jacksonii]
MLRRLPPYHAFKTVKSRPLLHLSNYSTTTTTPPTQQPTPRVIFSGIQPTGIPHLGNYLGALKPWVDLQNSAGPDTKLLFSVVDLHAITVQQDRAQLRKAKRESLAALLAIGLSEEKCTLFWQSEVTQHAELMWILSCTASMGYLSRMTQWKSKLELSDDASPLAGDSKSKLKLGLFSYPVLQAADILVHRATDVPVGEDQIQHIEFTRECVTNFNHTVGNPVLVRPSALISPSPRIKSLTTPHLKMSKSHPAPSSRLLLTDCPTTLTKKIQASLTDAQNHVSYDPSTRPGVSNLLEILSAFDAQGRSARELAEWYEGRGVGLGTFKKEVAAAVVEGLEGVRTRWEEIMGDAERGYVEEVARRGAKRARENAEETMVKVREAVGL